MLTLSKFQQATGLSSALAGKWFPVVLAAMQKYDISTPLRQAHFLAQVGHESSGFVHVEESLNYRYGALLAMFGNRISQEDAFKYGRVDSGLNAHPADQKMIGSIIYASRNGNGDRNSGDGYRYRGRGLIQVTGKANYAADSDDVSRITRIINGGTNGLEDRKARLTKAKGVLCSG